MGKRFQLIRMFGKYFENKLLHRNVIQIRLGYSLRNLVRLKGIFKFK